MSCGVLMKLSWNSGAICAGIPTFRQQLYCDDDVLRFRFGTFIGTSSVHNLAGSILRTNFVSDILLTQSGGQTLADTILRAILRTKYCERGLAYKILRTNHAPSPRFSFSSVRVSASCRFATSLSPLRSRWCVCRNIFRARASRLACGRRYHAPVAQRFARTNIGTVGRLRRCFVAVRRSIVFAVRVTLPCRCVRPLRLRVCGCEYLSSRRFSFPSDRVSAS